MLARLERIESLDRRGAHPSELVDELRGLLAEAEAWSEREGGEEGKRAVDELRRALNLRKHACQRDASCARDDS